MGRRGAALEPLLLVSPGIALLFGAFLFPVGQILVLSLVPPEAGLPLWANFQRFFADDYYLRVAARTLRLSLLITAITALIGFPLAYLMARASRRVAFLLLLVTVLPLMTSVVVRTFGWMVLLGRGGPISELLMLFGLRARDAVLLHTETGIVIAMVQVLLPFMVLTTLGVIAGIHPHLEEAARTMGAGFYRTLRHVVLPLSLPGLVSGSLLVFVISISSFITPNLVGGVRLPVMAGAIYQQAVHTLDWSFAAAQSVLLLAAVLALLVPYLALARR
jgi:putative spermidine/putrescine transport system permease protein